MGQSGDAFTFRGSLVFCNLSFITETAKIRNQRGYRKKKEKQNAAFIWYEAVSAEYIFIVKNT